MASSELPARPNIETLRKRAKRIKRSEGLTLSAAHLQLAQEFGCESWRHLLDEAAFLLVKDDLSSRAERAVLETLTGNTRLVGYVSRDGTSLLHWASWFGREATVRRLIEMGADASLKDRKFGATAIGWAHENGKLRIVELLLELGVEVDLSRAAMMGLGDRVAAILAQRPEAIHDVTDHLPPLVQAALWGRIAVVEQLLTAGAAVDAATAEGATALHAAGAKGHARIARRLLHAGASTAVRDHSGRTPADAARVAGHDTLADLLESTGGAES